MSEMVERVAKALFLSRYPSEVNGDQKTESFWPHRVDELVSGPPFDADGYRFMARATIEAMRPEFERISESYSPQGDDTVWVDDRTPIGQYVDSIINRVDA